MVFHRHARIYISFDCVDYDGNVHEVYGGDTRQMEFDPVDFANKRAAYDFWGDLHDWADDMGEKIAKAEAENYCGEETFKATNVNWLVDSEREWGDIPADVLGNIEVIIREMKENADNVDYVIELNNELDKILSQNDLTREDIKDML